MQNGTPVSEWDTDGPVSSSGGREVSRLGNSEFLCHAHF